MNNPKQQNQESTRGLIAWFADNHVAANILMALFLIGGLISVSAMRTETFPSIDPRMITVTVPYPGATPFEVADSITSRVEEALVGIDGVKRLSSRAYEGTGVVSVELKDFANQDDVYNDVETAVNGLSAFPPEDAERPTIQKSRITPLVLTLALHGEVEEKILKYWAELIEDEMRQLPGVAKTGVSGIRDYQISIEIPETRLREYGLSLQDVEQAVRGFSVDTPAGSIESAQGDILLRVQDKKKTGEGFEQVVLRTLPDGSVLRIGDIGTVVDSFADENLISRFNGERAAFIDIFRSDTDDTITVAETAKTYLQNLSLPDQLTLSLQGDQTIALQDRINLMLRNGIIGFMLVFVILLLFLDMKLAFWTSIAIPVSFLGGLMMIHFMGFSLNMISIFALIVVLGVVVDDAIVTGESIFDAQDREPNNPYAVLKGVRRVIAPVAVGVTTTMAAFAPLIFSTGTLGQIIMVIPIVVIPILAVSLLEAFFILPAHLSHSGRWSQGIMADIRARFAGGLAHVTENYVLPVARLAISWRYATLALFLSLAILSAGLFSSGLMRFVFFPQIESDTITVGVTMPQGTPFQETTDIMTTIDQRVQGIRDNLEQQEGKDIFISTSLTIGAFRGVSGGPGGGAGGKSASNLGELIIQLVPSDFRSPSSADVEKLIRAQIETLPGIESLSLESSLIGEEADIEVELKHPNDETLNEAADALKNALIAINGTKEVTDSFQEGKTEYVFELTEEGLSVGLSPAELGAQLRAAYFGLEVQRFQRGRSEVIVYARYPKADRESLAMLQQTRIRLPNGAEVPLTRVAKIKQQQGYAEIQTVNGNRIVSVTGDVDYEVTTPGAVMAQMRGDILPALQARYAGLSYSFEGESREQAEDLQSLGSNMLIALMLIYVLLGSQLRSYAQPLIIMAAIPFGVVGAIWGHFLLGYDLTFISLFGIVALSGVVVNDSVVLMDYYNQKRREGLRVYKSMSLAIARRFRPILLTSMTTSLGLLPVIMETSLQARFLIPMVVSLATGIIFATFVIMLLVPCLVMIGEDIKRLFKKHVSQKLLA